MLPLALPKVTTMKATSSPSSSTPLKESVKPYQSTPTCWLRGGSACLLELGTEDRVLVMQSLEAAGPQDRLA